MLLAQDAWALAQLSGGRFELGLGPQVKGNVERRFGMPWSAPAARMHDYVGALRAVFASWQHGRPLRFESASYTLTRMQPFFAPGPIEQFRPMQTSAPMTALAPITVPLPISARGPITAPGSTVTSSSSFASGWT